MRWNPQHVCPSASRPSHLDVCPDRPAIDHAPHPANTSTPGAVLCPCSAMLAFCERREGNNKQRKREKKERMNMNFFVLDVSRWIHGSTAARQRLPGCLALMTQHSNFKLCNSGTASPARMGVSSRTRLLWSSGVPAWRALDKNIPLD